MVLRQNEAVVYRTEKRRQTMSETIARTEQGSDRGADQLWKAKAEGIIRACHLCKGNKAAGASQRYDNRNLTPFHLGIRSPG